MLSVIDVNKYFLNPYAIMPIVVAWISLFQGIFIYYLDKKNNFNKCVYYFCVAVFLWQSIMGELLSCHSVFNATLLSKILFSVIAITSAIVFHLSTALTGLVKKKKTVIKAIYFCSIFVIFIIFYKGFFSGIKSTFFGMYPSAGSNMYILVSFLSVCFILSYMNFIQYHFSSRKAEDRRYARFLMMLYLVLQFAFLDVSITYYVNIMPASSIIFLFILLNLSFEEFRVLKGQVITERWQHKSELSRRALEVSKIMRDLKESHLKLLESGKISALASLSAGILHQISQPITAIKGVSSFLKKEVKEDDPYYKAIYLMDEQSTVLRNKLNDILALIKHRKMRKEIVDVNDIVLKVINLVADEIRIRNIKWEARLGSNLPNVFADKIHLQQIFINIITNSMQALDLIENKDARYLIIYTKISEDKKKVNIGFQDTGPGVSEEDREYLFEPFLPAISKRAGIGLALCKDLIDEHLGEITLENVPDGGANFIVSLPMYDGKAFIKDIIQ